MVIRSEDKFITVVCDPVRVTHTSGSMHARAAIVDIRSGNVAKYHPEADVLVNRKIDSVDHH